MNGVRARSWGVVCAAILLVPAPSGALPAQAGASLDSVAAPGHDEPHQIRWYEAAAVLGGIGALSLLDQPVHRFVQAHRSQTLNDIADVFRVEGEPVYYAGISLGVLGAGVITGDPEVQRTGVRLSTTVAVSAAAMSLLKLTFGRARPTDGVGAFSFHPFSPPGNNSGSMTRGALPSGHTTAAFAVATTLADEVDSPVADVLLYTAAAGTAWSRINDNRHWLTDTSLGAIIGITASKIVSGRWRIFNFRPPSFLVGPNGKPAVGMTITF
jgi:membrane-associated phospholipid phosphatase